MTMSNKQQTHAVDPSAWLSPRRRDIELLLALYSDVGRICLRQPDDIDARLAEIDRARTDLLTRARPRRSLRALISGHDYADADVQAELRTLEQAQQQLEAQRRKFQETASEAADEWESIRQELQEELEAAVEEEFTVRIHKQCAPWVQITLGPPPPANRRDLLERRELLGRYLTEQRIRHEIYNPNDPGIRQDQGPLLGDIATLRGWINDARHHGPSARKFESYTRRQYQPGTIDLPGYRRRDA